jgi:hypothetical protein
MGSNAGTGQPITFQCSQCRKKNDSIFRRPYLGPRTGFRVKLTGKKRPCKQGNAGGRNSRHRRQYECLDCGHVGWSRHIDLERQEKISTPTKMP